MLKKILWLMFIGAACMACSSDKPEVPVSTDCASSAACKESGQCTDENGTCVVGSQADCQASKVCKTQGWCAVTTVGGIRACKP